MSRFAKLRDDLISSASSADGQTVYTIKDPITGRYYRLREPEHWLVNQLDGDRSYEEVAESFRNKFNLNITAENVQQFVDTLEGYYFLENSRAEQEISRTSLRAGRKESLFSRMLFIKIKGFNPGKLLDQLVRIYRPFNHPVAYLFHFLLLAVGMSVLFGNASEFAVTPAEIFRLGSVAAIVISFLILIIVHEFAHAIICRLHGGEVREMGFLLLYFQPCFYCDLSDAWLFKEKKHRIAVSLAGPYAQLLATAVAVLVWRATVPGTFVSEIARIVTMVSWVTLAFNFNPLIRLDGYYLLADWVEIPNLRAKSFAYLGNFIKRRLLGWPIDREEVTARQRRIYFIYAFFALIYSALLIGYALLLAGRVLIASMGGFGLLLLFVVLFVMLRTTFTNAFMGLLTHLKYMKRILTNPIRLITHLVIATGVVLLVFVVPFTHRVTGEVSTRAIAEFNLQVNKFGLLERNLRRGGDQPENRSSYLQMTSTDMAELDLVPYVTDGQMVKQGDTLAVLLSNQVAQDILIGESLLNKLERQLALLESPPKPEEILQSQSELDAARIIQQKTERDRDRIKELSLKKLITAEELERAQSEVDIAIAEVNSKRAALELVKAPPKDEELAVLQAEIDRQQASLGFLRRQEANQVVTAPIAGTVGAVRTDDRIMTISNNETIELLVPVSDDDIKLIQLGQMVTLKVRSFPEREFVGRVAYVPRQSQLVNSKPFFLVSVVIDNRDGSLFGSMTGYAKIEIGQSSLYKLASRRFASVVRVEFWSWW